MCQKTTDRITLGFKDVLSLMAVQQAVQGWQLSENEIETRNADLKQITFGNRVLLLHTLPLVSRRALSV